MTTTLSVRESQDLERLERIVETGLATFQHVALALVEIRRRNLFRTSHATWTDYLRDRWKLGRVHAFRLVQASEVVESLLPMGNVENLNERQARELVPLDEASRRQVWAQAQASGEPVTAERLHKLVSQALAGLTPEQQAALVEEAEERVLRPTRRGPSDRQQERVQQIVRLFSRLRRLIAGLGPEYEPDLELLEKIRLGVQGRAV